MFWQFETGAVSHIDAILDKEDVTLVSLFDEDDLLQECKGSNTKLLDFLTKPEIMEEMVTLITTEPIEDAEEKIRYKQANLACELLTSDVQQINDSFVSNENLLNKLYSFVGSEKLFNPLLASFFSKTMSLLSTKNSEMMFKFLQTKENFVTQMLNHIETSAIMDLMLKLITGVDNNELRSNIIKWLHESELIWKLISIFKKEHSNGAQANAAQFICDMIRTSREHQSLLQDKAEKDLLLEDIESTDVIKELLNNMFETRTDSSLVNGIAILQSLLEYKRHSANIIHQQQQQQTPHQNNIQAQNEYEGIPSCLPQTMFSRNEAMAPDQMTPVDIQRLSKSVQQVHAAIVPRLSDFHTVLLDPPKQNSVLTTVGIIEKPLGATRLEIVHLIRALLTSNNPEINIRLSELKTVQVILDLFFQYPWNNFLHTQVEQSIKSILSNAKSNSPVTTPAFQTIESTSILPSSQAMSILVKQLFIECQIIKHLLDIWDSNNSNGVSKPQRPGYMGHLIKIFNHILENKENEAVKEAMSQMDEDSVKKWTEFTESTLTEINKRIQTPLVNEMPSAYDENTARQQENALQNAFMEYQMQQMTKYLCTEIEFSANEFTEIDDSIQPQVDNLTKVNFNIEAQMQEPTKNIDLFEKLCAERVKPNLDSDSSDEDNLWEEKEMGFNQSEDTSAKKPKSEDIFGSDASVSDIKMDVDNSDPWNNISGCGSGNIPMDTADPWTESSDTNKTHNENSTIKEENNSWADFSNFPPAGFAVVSDSPPNICLPSSMPSSIDNTNSKQFRGKIMSENKALLKPSVSPINDSETSRSESKSGDDGARGGKEMEDNILPTTNTTATDTNVLNGPH